MHKRPNNWIMRPNNWNYSNLNSRLVLVLLAPISPDKLYIKKYGLIWPFTVNGKSSFREAKALRSKGGTRRERQNSR